MALDSGLDQRIWRLLAWVLQWPESIRVNRQLGCGGQIDMGDSYGDKGA